jgi:hypothetical protein
MATAAMAAPPRAAVVKATGSTCSRPRPARMVSCNSNMTTHEADKVPRTATKATMPAKMPYSDGPSWVVTT